MGGRTFQVGSADRDIFLSGGKNDSPKKHNNLQKI